MIHTRYTTTGQKHMENNVWKTIAILASMLPVVNSDWGLDGGPGNDYIFGQLGKDTIEGGLGNDTIFGDTANIGLNSPNMPRVYNVLKCMDVTSTLVNKTSPVGNVMHVPFTVSISFYYFQHIK